MIVRWAREHVNIAGQKLNWQLKTDGARQISHGMSSQASMQVCVHLVAIGRVVCFHCVSWAAVVTSQPYGPPHQAQGTLVLLCQNRADEKGARRLTR